MRIVIFLQFLFIVVNSCKNFWNEWKIFSCVSSANRCYTSKKHSSVEIYDEGLSITCNEETIYSQLMRCLKIEHVKTLEFIDCYMLNFNVGIFASGYGIVNVSIKYRSIINTRNMESASFINMPSLKSVFIINAGSSEVLNLTFYNLPSLTSLNIQQYNFITFPLNLFQHLRNLTELSITNGNLQLLPEELFYGLYNLQKLDLSFNQIESIHPLVFRNLTRLEYLDLNANPIKNLAADLLKGLFNLRDFRISGRRIFPLDFEIPSGLFQGLYNLTDFQASQCYLHVTEDMFNDATELNYVRLFMNKIENLPPKIFQNNKNLKEFHCTTNEISTLPREIFHGLSKLKTLSLWKNRLENLPEDVFFSLSNLELLDLSQNRLQVLPEKIFLPLNNLRKLVLDQNNLSKFPNIFSKKLEHISLRKVGLTKWPTINWTEYNLKYVDFSWSHFETVKLPIFTPNRMKVYLYFCNIKTIYVDKRKYGLKMPTYKLKYNQVTCDGELRQFIATVKSNLALSLKMFPDLNYLKCYGEKRRILDNR